MLVRKARRVGSSLIITIPSHIAEAYGITTGTKIEIVPTDGRLILKKIRDDINAD